MSVSLVYDESSNKYIPDTPKQMAIYQYEQPKGSSSTSVTSNGLITYPINTEKFSNIDTTFDAVNNEIELPKGDYLIDGFYTIYHNYLTRYAFMKMYLQIVSPTPTTDIASCSSSNVYYNSAHNQSDYRMNDHAIFNSYFSLNQRSTIRIMLRHSNSTTGTELGRALNLDTQISGGTNIPEVYGSFKFIKIS